MILTTLGSKGLQRLNYKVLTYAEHWKKKLEENRNFLLLEEKINKTDESKRPGRPTTSEELSWIDGSFRKLNID